MRTYRGGHRSNLAAPDVNVAMTADASIVVIRASAPGSAPRGAAATSRAAPVPLPLPRAGRAKSLRRLTPGGSLTSK
jgi:hypothetical protein